MVANCALKKILFLFVYVPAAAIGRFCAGRCGPQKAAVQVYRVRYYKSLKIVKISEISEKNIFLIRFILILNYFVSNKMMSET